MRKHALRIAAIVIILLVIPGLSIFKVFAGDTTQGVQTQEQANQLQNQSVLVKNQPAPQLDYSVERQNLVNRLKIENDKNLVGYVYLLGQSGQVIAQYTTKGKVSSLNSSLTGAETLVDGTGNICNTNSSTYPCYSVESPDYDGSYGSNPDGIFFFTDTGAMIEWSGSYLYSNQPMTVQTPVSLVQQVQQ